MIRYVFYLAVILCQFALGAQAQSQKKQMRIIVSCTCTDSVGKLFSKELRDEITKSPRFVLVENTKENRSSALKMQIISLAIEDDSTGQASSGAISTVFTIEDTFIDHFIQVCGKTRINACAVALVSELDSDINN